MTGLEHGEGRGDVDPAPSSSSSSSSLESESIGGSSPCFGQTGGGPLVLPPLCALARPFIELVVLYLTFLILGQ
jgi:hypothetical protein